jgi:hypothetical protein
MTYCDKAIKPQSIANADDIGGELFQGIGLYRTGFI